MSMLAEGSQGNPQMAHVDQAILQRPIHALSELKLLYCTYFPEEAQPFPSARRQSPEFRVQNELTTSRRTADSCIIRPIDEVLPSPQLPTRRRRRNAKRKTQGLALLKIGRKGAAGMQEQRRLTFAYESRRSMAQFSDDWLKRSQLTDYGRRWNSDFFQPPHADSSLFACFIGH